MRRSTVTRYPSGGVRDLLRGVLGADVDKLTPDDIRRVRGVMVAAALRELERREGARPLRGQLELVAMPAGRERQPTR